MRTCCLLSRLVRLHIKAAKLCVSSSLWLFLQGVKYRIVMALATAAVAAATTTTRVSTRVEGTRMVIAFYQRKALLIENDSIEKAML